MMRISSAPGAGSDAGAREPFRRRAFSGFGGAPEQAAGTIYEPVLSSHRFPMNAKTALAIASGCSGSSA